MLNITIDMNGRKIDMIKVKRLEDTFLNDDHDKLYKYKVYHDKNEYDIECEYGDYKPLLLKALNVIIENEGVKKMETPSVRFYKQHPEIYGKF